MIRPCRVLLPLIASCAWVSAHAHVQGSDEPLAPIAARASPFGDRQGALPETLLDRVRGGFSSGDGLVVSFGISRAVFVNGTLVTTSTMNVTQLGQAAAGHALASVDSGTVALVQNGAGNTVANGSISAQQVGTVVQNTLDGQNIQSLTVINATVNSLGLLKNINLGASLQGAVVNSLQR